MSPNYIHGRLDPNELFRERRRRERRRRRRRRAALAAVLLALVAGLAVGATFFTRGGSSAEPPPTTSTRASRPRAPRLPPVPREIRGVHVTMGLASIPGRLERYVRLAGKGLNTIELDIKDENGKVGFRTPGLPRLARQVGAAERYYDVRGAVRLAHQRGLYLIGRVVTFEDPTLTAARPDLAIRRPDGSVWTTTAGLGWANPYDTRVWKYDVDIAAAAAKAGFDEIQFDYVRFPTDGDLSQAVYAHKRAEPLGATITRFVAYAARRLHKLHVRVSADVFGLAATRDLGIGQVPRKLGRYLDALYPMVYPSHYNPGEYDLIDPEAFPGRTVAHSLHDFQRQLEGERARLVPWLQDFSIHETYGLPELADQIDAARTERARGFLLWNPDGVYTESALAWRK